MNKTTVTVPTLKKQGTTYLALPDLCLLLHAHADGYDRDGDHGAALVIRHLARDLQAGTYSPCRRPWF